MVATINALIVELQALAAILPGGGENEIRIKTQHPVSGSVVVNQYWDIDSVLMATNPAKMPLIRAGRSITLTEE